MDEQRALLADYVDRRVSVEGVFERLADARGGKVKVALIQDMVVTVDGKEIDVGHIWVQHADNFVNIEPFERVTFLARVGVRRRINGHGDLEEIPNLMFPTAVTPKVQPALTTKPEPAEEMTRDVGEPQVAESGFEPERGYEHCDPVQLLIDVSALAERAGGWKKLEALVTLLQRKDCS